MSGLPALPPKVSASLWPSGDHAGAPLTPTRADTCRRSPLRTSCTYTAACLVSKDTYASHCPSGDQAGDMSGKRDSRIMCWFAPSASATMSWKSNAGGEGAAYAEDLLVDDIAHAVRCVAHRAGGTREALPGELRSGERVHELEVDGKAAVIQRRGATNYDVVAPDRLPRRARHLRGAAGLCG